MYEKAQEEFLQGISRFYVDETIPPRISLNMRRALVEHKKRLENKGIVYRESFLPSEDAKPIEYSFNKGAFKVSDISKHYNTVTELSDGTNSLRYDPAKDDIVCLNVINRNDDEKDDDTIILACPNCGHQGSVHVLVDGCPMCGTKFKIDDLYPCVNMYYSRPYPLPPSNDNVTIKRAKQAAIGGVVIAVLAGLSAFFDPTISYHSIRAKLIDTIVMTMGGFGIGFLVCYAILTGIYAFMTVKGLVKMAADTLDTVGTLNSQALTNKAIRPYDPQFSFEVFEGKILSYIRTLAFSDNRDNCSLYCGEDDLSFMNDLVDVRYRGATKFEKAELTGDLLRVTMTVYLDNIYYRNGQFELSREKFSAELIRYCTVQTRPDFTAYSITCRECGAPFDSVLTKTCPFCGRKLELAGLDWTISKLSLV